MSDQPRPLSVAAELALLKDTIGPLHRAGYSDRESNVRFDLKLHQLADGRLLLLEQERHGPGDGRPFITELGQPIFGEFRLLFEGTDLAEALTLFEEHEAAYKEQGLGICSFDTRYSSHPTVAELEQRRVERHADWHHDWPARQRDWDTLSR
jgi:hypothetical protein